LKEFTVEVFSEPEILEALYNRFEFPGFFSQVFNDLVV